MTVRIITGHVLDCLAQLPDESVHCVVTSPPYFGLRSYGTEPQVWGGNPHCYHEWNSSKIGMFGRNDCATMYGSEGPIKKEGATASLCRHCRAWRGDLGLEPTPALYIEHMVAVFREVRRVLRKDGTLWLNIGDSYHNFRSHKQGGQPPQGFHKDAKGQPKRHGQPEIRGANRAARFEGIKEKDLLGIPWMLAFALRDDGWYLRSEITWAKRAPMPESVTDRPTCATEKVFLLTKSPRYFYDAEAVREPVNPNNVGECSVVERAGGTAFDAQGKPVGAKRVYDVIKGANLRNWWLLGPEPFPEAHFATFPTEIPRRAILAGSLPGGTILDPFLGAGTTALVADQLGRDCIGIELNSQYAAMAESRLRDDAGMFAQVAAE